MTCVDFTGYRWSRSTLIAQPSARRLDALEQQLQPGDVELQVPGLVPVADETSPLQALGPQTEAAAVPVQRLAVVTAAVDANVEVTRARILLEGVKPDR